VLSFWGVSQDERRDNSRGAHHSVRCSFTGIRAEYLFLSEGSVIFVAAEN